MVATVVGVGVCKAAGAGADFTIPGIAPGMVAGVVVCTPAGVAGTIRGTQAGMAIHTGTVMDRVW